MFKFNYNILAAIIVLIQLMSVGLSFLLFGVSKLSDIFFFTMTLVGSLQLIQLMFIEQFMYFFHKVEKHSLSEAESFYHYAATLTLIVGIGTALILYGINAIQPHWLQLGLPQENFYLFHPLLLIMVFGLVFYPLLAVNDRLLNARGMFVHSYLISSSMHIALFITLLIMVIFDLHDILYIGVGYTLGLIIGAFVSSLVIKRSIGFDLKFVFKHPLAKEFFLKSFGMRLGHNIYMVLFYPITNYFLALMPTGSISVFYYIYRAVVALFSITAGPSYKMFMAKMSYLWSKKKYYAMKIHMKRYTAIASIQYIIMGLLGYFLLTIGLSPLVIYLNLHLATQEIEGMIKLYPLILIWQFIVIFESSYTGVLIVAQQVKKFILINFLFISLYSVFNYLFIDSNQVFMLAIFACFAQLISMILYRYYANQEFKTGII
jgi:hypothetical protein